MEYKYLMSEKTDEPNGYGYLPILSDQELVLVKKSFGYLENRDLERTLSLLEGILSDCHCTDEKDSFCAYLEGIIKMFYTDSQQMIEDLNYVIYQMF